MAKGATSKKKREDEKRQEPQQRQDSRQREETRQRQQRTQRETSQNNSASSRQTTRRDVAPAAIPVLEERSTPRRSASGRNVAQLFPEYDAPQTTNIPKVEPIPTTNNQSQGFRDDLDERLRRRTTQGIRLDAEDRIKASDASQYGAERAETTPMPVGTDIAEKGRKMAQRASQAQAESAPIYNENGLTETAQKEVDDLNRRIEKLSMAPLQNERQIAALQDQVNEIYNNHHASSEDYLVSRDKYDELMQNPELANDIGNLTQIIYNPRRAGGKASADAMAEKLTNGQMDSEAYYSYLEDKYDLSREELEDMALTRHSDERTGYAQKFGEKAAEFGEAHPRLGTTLSFAGSVGNFVEGGYNTLVGGLTDDNRRLSKGFNSTKTGLREGVKENLNSDFLKGLYDVGAGVGDMVLGAAMGNAPLLLAGNTANEALLSADARGQSARKAATYGGLSGVADYYFNKIGLDKAKELAFDSVKASGVKKMLANMGIAGLGEAGENVLQDITQSFLDEFINGNRSDLRTSFEDKVASGMSEDQAFAQTVREYIGQLGISGLTGFAMGAAMQGGTTLKNGAEAGLARRFLNRNSERVNAKLDEWRRNQAPQLEQPETSQEMPLDELGEQLNPIEAMNAERQPIVENNEVSEMPVPENSARTVSDAKQKALDLYRELEEGVTSDEVIPASSKENYVEGTLNQKQPTYEGNYADNLHKSVKEMEMDDNAREYVNDQIDELNGYLDRIDNAQSVDELRSLIHDAILTQSEIENTLRETAQGRIVGKYEFDDVTREFAKAINGKRILVTDEMLAELPDMKRSDLNTALYFKGDGQRWKASALTAKADNTIPMDSIFPEIDEATGGAISSYMERNGLNPGNAKDQLVGLVEYANDLKANRESTKLINYDGEITDDLMNEIDARSMARQRYLENYTPEVPELNDIVPSSGKFDESRVITNTAINAGLISPDELRMNPAIKELSTHEVHENKATLEKAINDVKYHGDQLLDEFVNGTTKIDTDLNVDRSMILLYDPRISNGESDAILRNVTENGTKAGEFLQALKKWANTSVGAFIKATKVDNETTKAWISSHQEAEKANGELSERLKRAIDTITEDKRNNPKDPATLAKIRQQVENTLKARQSWISDMNNINRLMGDDTPFEFSPEDIDYLANLLDHNASVQTIRDALNTKLATGRFGISAETQNKVNELFQYAKQFDENSEDFLEAQAEAFRLLAEETCPNGTAIEKFDTWRYIAMLGNPKTMLRNYVGNKMFGVVTGVSNNLAAAMEHIADASVKGVGKLEANSIPRLQRQIAELEQNIGNSADPMQTQRVINDLQRKIQQRIKDSAEHANGIQRTKEFLNPVKDKGLINSAKADATRKRARQIDNSKYEKMDQDSLKRYRSAFYTSAKVDPNDSKAKQTIDRGRQNFSDVMQLAEEAVNQGISDKSAVISKYSTSLAGYMKANGIDQSAFDASYKFDQLERDSRMRNLSAAESAEMERLRPIAAQLEKARDYAMKQADYATFHEDNEFAKKLTETSSLWRNSSNPLARLGGYAIEGVVPFKKTPANVLKSGVQYSPLGLIDSILQTGKFVKENTGRNKGNLAEEYAKTDRRGRVKKDRQNNPIMVQKSHASDVIESWARTLTGTGMAALGAYLYNKGVLHISDKDTKYQDELEGKQEYSLTINGHNVTIDWGAPAALSMFLGAQMAKVREAMAMDSEDWYKNMDLYLNALNTIAEPIVETSMMQGVKDTLETAANAARNDDELSVPTLLAYNMLSGYATQAIPTLFGQEARTIDNTRRSTYTDKEGVAGTLDKQFKKTLNKLPFLSMLNEPYYDTYGQTQQNSPFSYGADKSLIENADAFAGNALYQMGSVGYYDKINRTPADQIAWDVYNRRKAVSKGDTEANNFYHDSSIFAQWQGSKKIDGKRVSPEDYATYSQVRGQANYDIRSALAESEWFSGLSNNEKGEILKGLNPLADKIGESAINPAFASTDKGYQAYAEGGVDGYLKYLEENKLLSEAGVKRDSKAGEGLLSLYETDPEAALAQSDTLTAISQSGLPTEAKTAYQQRGSNIFPDMSGDEYVQHWNSLNTDGKNGLSQTDLLDAFNNNKEVQGWIASLEDSGMTKEQALRSIWSGFLDSYEEGSSQVPYIKDDGTIGRHKETAEEQTSEETPSDVAEEVNNNSSEDWLTQVTSNRKPSEVTTLEPQYQPGAYNTIDDVWTSMENTDIDTSGARGYWGQASSLGATPQQFYEYYNAIDSALGAPNGGISKDEWVQYLNNNDKEYKDDLEIIKMLYNTNWPALKYVDGTWSK